MTKKTQTLTEIERRFLIKTLNRKKKLGKAQHILQGYFEGRSNFRVRIIDGKEAILTQKTGRGQVRVEHNKDVSIDVGRYLMGVTPYRLRKDRYTCEGWEIDFFKGPLKGLVLAEFEMKSPKQKVRLPEWITDAVEVTDTLTNQHLARIAYDLSEADTRNFDHEKAQKKVPSIVLTGGPCSGKSSLMKFLQKQLKGVVHCVPEVATIVIEQVGAKPPFDDHRAMRVFQRTIHRVQQGFEDVSHRQAIRDGKKAVLLDRGTVDGAAYMKDGTDELANICQTTLDDEYARYDAVICVAVPPRHIYDANKANNPARSETHEEAEVLGEKIRSVWSRHPQFFNIETNQDWDIKCRHVLDVVEQIIDRS